MPIYIELISKTRVLGKICLIYIQFFWILTVNYVYFCGELLKALSAKWEPPHGRFRHLLYPWSEYVKVGAVLRYCAYEVMALHGVLHSQIQVPPFVLFKTCIKMELK